MLSHKKFLECRGVNKKPVKPKEDLATRIQNKAIDHEAKRQEKKALSDEKKTKLKNAGKALSAQPKDWEKSSKNLADKIGKWDIKRRKEFFLKPGFRHKIFRNIYIYLHVSCSVIRAHNRADFVFFKLLFCFHLSTSQNIVYLAI